MNSKIARVLFQLADSLEDGRCPECGTYFGTTEGHEQDCEVGQVFADAEACHERDED